MTVPKTPLDMAIRQDRWIRARQIAKKTGADVEVVEQVLFMETMKPWERLARGLMNLAWGERPMSDRSRRLLGSAPQLAGLTNEEIDLLQSLVESGVRFMVVGMGAAILQSAPGVTFRDFEEEYEQAVDVEIVPGLPVKVLPLERVLASKRAAGRPKDKAAIPMLKNAIKAIKKTR